MLQTRLLWYTTNKYDTCFKVLWHEEDFNLNWCKCYKNRDRLHIIIVQISFYFIFFGEFFESSKTRCERTSIFKWQNNKMTLYVHWVFLISRVPLKQAIHIKHWYGKTTLSESSIYRICTDRRHLSIRFLQRWKLLLLYLVSSCQPVIL